MSAGQMVEDVRLAVEGRAPVGFVGRSGGGAPTTAEVLQAAESLARQKIDGQISPRMNRTRQGHEGTRGTEGNDFRSQFFLRVLRALRGDKTGVV